MDLINHIIHFEPQEKLRFQIKLQPYKSKFWQYYQSNNSSYTTMEIDIYTRFAFGNSNVISIKQLKILDGLFTKNGLSLNDIVNVDTDK